MATNNQTEEEKEKFLIKNWEIFKGMALKLSEKSERLEEFLDTVQEEMMIAPASTRTDLVCSYAGGLVEHSLRVFSHAAKLRKVYGCDKDIPASSLILVSLFHDVGKIGDEVKPYYLEETDQWRVNKLGQNYEINQRFSHIPVSQLSLRWLANYGFKLDLDEWHSISSIREQHRDESTPSKGEPMLSVILQQAIRVAIMQGKNKKELSVIVG